MQQQSIKRASIIMEPESVPSYRCDDTGQIEEMSAAFHLAFLVMDIFKSGAEQYGKKFVELLH